MWAAIRWGPHDSALRRSQPGWTPWTEETYIQALIFDQLALLTHAMGGGKGRRPKPLPRPQPPLERIEPKELEKNWAQTGVIGGEPQDLAVMKEWMEAKNGVRR
ncbi:hypothetical protein UM93_14615 [Psychromicrobium lacuslunae]|uniref:Uncharacterized protein n=1 Tax=Psychromicrobium lacuslunae TaxID=1618207 RepID=A0A0D4C222_9MICC|nr:hypothetical protein UM93_14615 [Psychromicrobium lacuslunae]